MDKLFLETINKEFPPKEPEGFNCAVFFHHAKDGKLLTMSPLITAGKDTQIDINLIVQRLLLYADACKQMANDMANKTFNKN